MRCTLAMLFAGAVSIMLLSGCPMTTGDAGPWAAVPDGEVRVMDPATAAVDRSLPLATGMAMDVAISGDGALTAAAGSDGTLSLWRTASGEAVANADLATGDRALTAVAFSGDSAVVVAGNAAGKLYVFAATGAKTFELQAHDSGITALAALDAGNLVVSTDRSGVLKVWNVAKGGLELVRAQAVVEKGAAVYAMAVSVTTSRVATAGADGKIRICDVNGQPKLFVPTGDLIAAVGCMAFSPSGKLLAVGLEDDSVRLFDMTKLALSRGTLQCAENPIVGVAFVGEDALVVGCSNGCLKQFDTKGKLVRELPKGDAMRALAVAADGKKIIVGQ